MIRTSRNSWSLIRVGDVSIRSHWLVHECYWLEHWSGEWSIASLGLPVFGNEFWGPIGVIDWDLWTVVIAELCKWVCDGPEGLLLRVLWESLILYMGCELWGPIVVRFGPQGMLSRSMADFLLRVCCLYCWLFEEPVETSWWHHCFCQTVAVNDLGVCTYMLVFRAQMGIWGRGSGDEFTFPSLAEEVGLYNLPRMYTDIYRRWFMHMSHGHPLAGALWRQQETGIMFIVSLPYIEYHMA